jgi:hypothetical protein
MRLKPGLLWLLAIAWTAPVAAQTPPEEEPEAPAAESAAPAEAEAMPDVDIWSEDAADEDDVFIPTERISADSSIAYPADI